MVDKIIHNKRAVFAGIILALVISFFWYLKAVDGYRFLIDGKQFFAVYDKSELEKLLEEYKNKRFPEKSF